jgi:uncharacterized protein YkuJ
MANKNDEYICPDCNTGLILCQGKIRVHHFRHKVDTTRPCHYYNSPSESQIHKDAKLVMKSLLEKKVPISFVRKCPCCPRVEESEIPEVSETSEIIFEHRFEHNGLKIADVAYLDKGEILTLFEICNTHKTRNEDRPEPWFEIDAQMLIQMANNEYVSSLKIPCIRIQECDDCLLKKTDIEKYVRTKLGQKVFPKPEEFECSNPQKVLFPCLTCNECITGSKSRNYNFSNCSNIRDVYHECGQCNECKFHSWYRTDGHLRFNFDATEKTEKNIKIIELFANDFKKKKSCYSFRERLFIGIHNLK